MTQAKRKSNLMTSLFTFHDAETDNLYKLKAYTGLATMVDGKGDLAGWTNVLARLNVGNDMAQTCFTDEPQAVMTHAIKTMVGVFLSAKPNTPLNVTTSTGDAIRTALELTDEMQNTVTNREYQKSFSNAKRVDVMKLIQKYTPANNDNLFALAA